MPTTDFTWGEWGLLPPWLATEIGAPRTEEIRDPVFGDVLWPREDPWEPPLTTDAA